jgi:hypothetical protein
MASLSEAYLTPASDESNRIDAVENPQAYAEFASAVRHVKEARHVLGLVGGNDVSNIKGSVADLESDLLGITRPNSDSTERHHLPVPDRTAGIERVNPKISLKIDTKPVHLPVYQMWAYPSVIGPVPLEKETCSRPEKY